MKKIVMLFCLLMCMSLFSNEKNISVVVEPTFTISKEELKNENQKILEEIKKEFIGSKIAQSMNFDMLSSVENLEGIQKEMITKVFETVFKYTKVEVSEINYVSPHKAYLTIIVKTPDILGNMDKLQEKIEEKLLSNIGDMDYFEKNKNLSMEEVEKKIQKKMIEDVFKLMEEENAKITKENKYLINNFIVKVEKKANNWKINNNIFKVMRSY
ncbi:hypothetical protein EII29_06040 [Leptotrichia sp. OH3620_COT-345]|uniref:hypothetical protein n=1 Tax=Leptotrichia sp. OH3620_COT-345 TaxID=2491048 RepID=UPI000F652712|nr:hypothetical protein [Leptotrichia sp. OH3620_COT-345]RRD39600.1 hypothetical protein EII29_06040 [Leptotrichia sp. OH3620_COT-345]